MVDNAIINVVPLEVPSVTDYKGQGVHHGGYSSISRQAFSQTVVHRRNVTPRHRGAVRMAGRLLMPKSHMPQGKSNNVWNSRRNHQKFIP